MPDMNALMRNPELAQGLGKVPQVSETASFEPAPTGGVTDQEVLDLWEQIQPKAFDNRHVFLRQWTRNIYYILNRQWIEYHGKSGGWKDKRMASWIPRPVTNKCKETLGAIRALFTSIKLGVNVRPNGASAENVSAASTADDLGPTIHDNHGMNPHLTEFDFWLIGTGNAFLQEYIDYHPKNGFIDIETEACTECGYETTSDKLAGAQAVCPECGGNQFLQATDELTGLPKIEKRPIGRPATCVLSPLEIAFPNDYARFEDLPYIVRMRWRTKSYYEAHPTLRLLVPTISWQKAPSDESLTLFRSLSTQNDIGVTPAYWNEGSGQTSNDDGVPEYEVWMKPTVVYPQGLVFRIIGDKSGIVARVDDEAIPGPLPYTDVEGKPLFPFQHAGFEQVGGRIWASGPIDAIIQKQDQLNQLDSMILLIIQRMANPVWLEPKGADVERITGMPGLVIKWNPLTVGGNAKPERIDGVGPPAALFQIRQQLLTDIEELAGTFDIMKGQKPTGVEAFSALQLLDERSKSRFSSVFQARGDAYKGWFKIALELEREFGEEEQVVQSLTAAKTWTFQTFKRSQLQGSISVIVEDGSTTPKTNLGMRAAIQHAAGLGIIDMTDPDQRYEGLKLFGLTRLAPSIDVHVTAALRKQQAFEEWAVNPQAVQQSMMEAQQAFGKFQQEAAQAQEAMEIDPLTGQPTTPMPEPPSLLESTPLKWYGWYEARIHRQEFMKWANSDSIRELIQTTPETALLLETHLQEINVALQEQLMLLAPPAPMQGGGMAMANSNQNSQPQDPGAA